MVVLEDSPAFQLEVDSVNISFGGISALYNVSLAVEKGADFLIYGPIGQAPTMFPAIAMLDMLNAEGSDDFGITQTDGHPRQVLL